MTESDVLEFYRNCDYWSAQRMPARPSELHLPLFIARQDAVIIEQVCQTARDGVIKVVLSPEDCRVIAPVLLHESLFHFYKGFYNYLAARALLFGGLASWLNITLYYAKFYLARSIAALVGRQSYGMTRVDLYGTPNPSFIEEVASALGKSKRKSPLDYYRIRCLADDSLKSGQILFDRERVASHRDVWQDYKALDVNSLGLYPLAFTDADHLVQERNTENYSFYGYRQIDFNLPPDQFETYFERDYITKSKANTLYEEETGGVLLAISRQYGLYKKLAVERLPIENQKLAHMVDYCLPDSPAKERLMQLCQGGFPTRDLYSEDGDLYCDQKGRYL